MNNLEHPSSQDIFEDIHEWESGEINFSILNDDVNGRIPVLRVNSWEKFIQLLEEPYFTEAGSDLIFRGHRRYDWGLLPTLARRAESQLLTAELIEKQLGNFKRAIRGRLKDYALILNEDDDEIWAIGQHYGLDTPLLDWTYSPYVALFFAFSKKDTKQETDNPYRAVYIANKKLLEEENIASFVDPKVDIYGRLVNQAGLFMKAEVEQTIEGKILDFLHQNEDTDKLNDEQIEDETAKYICKIYIKNTEEIQNRCMKSLQKMNIHHANLFPDIQGAADYCNSIAIMDLGKTIYSSKDLILSPIKEKEASIVNISDEIPDLHEIEKILTAEHLVYKESPIPEIAKDIYLTFNKNKAIDWTEKDSVQAMMKIGWKRLLSQNGFDKNIDETVDMIMQFFKKNDQSL